MPVFIYIGQCERKQYVNFHTTFSFVRMRFVSLPCTCAVSTALLTYTKIGNIKLSFALPKFRIPRLEICLSKATVFLLHCKIIGTVNNNGN